MEDHKLIDVGIGTIYIDRYSWQLQIECKPEDRRYKTWTICIVPRRYGRFIELCKNAFDIYESISKVNLNSCMAYGTIKLAPSDTNNSINANIHGIYFETSDAHTTYTSISINKREYVEKMENIMKEVRAFQDSFIN